MSVSLHHAAEHGIEVFRRAVQRAARRDLLNNVDHDLEQMVRANARGDQWELEWARGRWVCVWDELEGRDGIPLEKAS